VHDAGWRARRPDTPYQYRGQRDSRKRIEKLRRLRHNETVIDNWMNPKVKLTAYAVLLILAVWFGWGFYSSYAEVARAAKQAAAATTAAEEPAPAPSPDSNSPPTTNALTNAMAAATNATAEATNAPGQISNAAPSAVMSSNEAPAMPAVEPAARTNAPAKKKAAKPIVVRDEGEVRGRMIAYLAALVGTLMGLGLLITYDVTHLVGGSVSNYLFYDLSEAVRDPVYERAEAEWANGHYLEAVQLMREFLKENPRELHAALRIAEIYEKDLKNDLAAALEYEEILKHKLPAERWGWAAIHLCNLYSKLAQQPKARALLRRIVEEYPRTAAAKKARAHLGLPELVEEEAEAAEAPVDAVEEENAVIQIEAPEPEAPPPPSEPPPTEPPKSNLPPGFRPRE
jgi:TolA-binding protein